VPLRCVGAVGRAEAKRCALRHPRDGRLPVGRRGAQQPTARRLDPLAVDDQTQHVGQRHQPAVGQARLTGRHVVTGADCHAEAEGGHPAGQHRPLVERGRAQHLPQFGGIDLVERIGGLKPQPCVLPEDRAADQQRRGERERDDRAQLRTQHLVADRGQPGADGPVRVGRGHGQRPCGCSR